MYGATVDYASLCMTMHIAGAVGLRRRWLGADRLAARMTHDGVDMSSESGRPTAPIHR